MAQTAGLAAKASALERRRGGISIAHHDLLVDRIAGSGDSDQDTGPELVVEVID